MMRQLIALAILIGLAGCGPSSGDGVGGVSAGEASALNDAAAMLDARAGETRTDDAGLNPAAMAAARAQRGRREPAAQNAADNAAR